MVPLNLNSPLPKISCRCKIPLTSFNELIEILNNVLGTNFKPEYFDMPYDPKTYQSNTQADTENAESNLGFKAIYTLKDGIKEYSEMIK